jgi:hypothetical protein
MDRKPVNCFDVGVCSELRQDARIDLRGDAVVGCLHTIKDSRISSGGAEQSEHTLLRPANPRHLRACCCLRRGALLRIGGTVALIAESLRIDFRGGFVL